MVDRVTISSNKRNVDSLYTLLLNALSELDKCSESLRLSVSGIRGLKPGERNFLVYIPKRGKWRRISRELKKSCLAYGNPSTFLVVIKYSYYGEDDRKHALHGDYFLLNLEYHSNSIELKVKHLRGLLRTSESYILEKITNILKTKCR